MSTPAFWVDIDGTTPSAEGVEGEAKQDECFFHRVWLLPPGEGVFLFPLLGGLEFTSRISVM